MDLKYTGNDIVLENGDLAVVSGINQSAQQVRDRLLTFVSEWFLNLSYGVDYKKDILVKNPNMNIVNARLKKAINESIEGEFENFEVTFKDREFTLIYDLLTTDGTVSDEINV